MAAHTPAAKTPGSATTATSPRGQPPTVTRGSHTPPAAGRVSRPPRSAMPPLDIHSTTMGKNTDNRRRLTWRPQASRGTRKGPPPGCPLGQSSEISTITSDDEQPSKFPPQGARANSPPPKPATRHPDATSHQAGLTAWTPPSAGADFPGAHIAAYTPDARTSGPIATATSPPDCGRRHHGRCPGNSPACRLGGPSGGASLDHRRSPPYGRTPFSAPEVTQQSCFEPDKQQSGSDANGRRSMTGRGMLANAGWSPEVTQEPAIKGDATGVLLSLYQTFLIVSHTQKYTIPKENPREGAPARGPRP